MMTCELNDILLHLNVDDQQILRIEHPQSLINKAQYKEFADHPRLGAAEYRLTHKSSSGRGVYTFCIDRKSVV